MEGTKARGIICIVLALGICAGAFGAHGLADKISPDSLASYKTGVYYLLINLVGLLAIINGRIRVSQYLIFFGALLFSLSIFLLATRGILLNLGSASWLGPVTPFGGLFMIIGWLMEGVGYLKGVKTN